MGGVGEGSDSSPEKTKTDKTNSIFFSSAMCQMCTRNGSPHGGISHLARPPVQTTSCCWHTLSPPDNFHCDAAVDAHPVSNGTFLEHLAGKRGAGSRKRPVRHLKKRGDSNLPPLGVQKNQPQAAAWIPHFEVLQLGVQEATHTLVVNLEEAHLHLVLGVSWTTL